MKRKNLFLVIFVFLGSLKGVERCLEFRESESPIEIIDNTKQVITVEIKQSTQDLIKILDNTIVNGKLKLFKGLKGKRQSKKKIIATTCQLEKIVNEAIEKIESKKGKKEVIIREKTEVFIAETKKSVFDMHKQMVTDMRKSFGKNPQIVKNNRDNTKNKIGQFEKEIIVKIAEFSDTLKEIVK